jgi:hypothetical protein
MPEQKRIPWLLLCCALALCAAPVACNNEAPEPIASNCKDPKGCIAKPQPLERIDAVDILMVIDNSASLQNKLDGLKRELPRMLNAVVGGKDGGTTFPAAASVHMAVATSDMGALGVSEIDRCAGSGDDGIFIRPNDAELSCERSYPGYLTFDSAPAALATVDTVGCVPLVGSEGCGFEQPLEASLKALWPASDDRVTFSDGESHGEGENGGFLREDSLLVVIVVTDEDDCSASDPTTFLPPNQLDPENPEQQALAALGLNLRCTQSERMHDVQRYVDGLKALRPDHPDRIVFAVIAGIPPELAPPVAGSPSDIADDAERDSAYDAILAHPLMQPTVDDRGTPDPADDALNPSCNTTEGRSFPPRRLIETARGFGQQAVLGSICQDDFGATAGMLIRTIGMRLSAAANTPADGGAP